MVVELQTNEPDGYGGRATAFIDSAHVVAIEPVSYFEGRNQRFGSRIHLSTGATIESSIPAKHVRAQVWPKDAQS